MEGEASPPKEFLGKETQRGSLKEEKNERERERRGEHEIEGEKEGEKLHFEVFLTSFSFIKVTTSVARAFIYSLGSILKKLL